MRVLHGLSRSTALLCVALASLTLLAAVLWLQVRPVRNEPFSHYLAEQWRVVRFGKLLNRETGKIVGKNALDCGYVRVGGSFTDLNKCIERAIKTKRAFKARWELPAIDAEVEDGFLGSADGRVFQFQHSEGPFVPNYRHVNIRECPQPTRVSADNLTGDLHCF